MARLNEITPFKPISLYIFSRYATKKGVDIVSNELKVEKIGDNGNNKKQVKLTAHIIAKYIPSYRA